MHARLLPSADAERHGAVLRLRPDARPDTIAAAVRRLLDEIEAVRRRTDSPPRTRGDER